MSSFTIPLEKPPCFFVNNRRWDAGRTRRLWLQELLFAERARKPETGAT